MRKFISGYKISKNTGQMLAKMLTYYYYYFLNINIKNSETYFQKLKNSTNYNNFILPVNFLR